ncbi:hypothetical protein [Brachyspira pilosicoli]|uniref:hypothetical protein n=1 Tax=Brachyspira pilosicoli TaxID=52584 RepID=UPI000E1ABE52|nr:hypothetical protein [Brachyspira pilosicoli]SUW04495.1 Uncharacterised protein [Brachyspira pilosicoli]
MKELSKDVNDLIERYIYAVTKKMSSKIRNDVADELKTLIYDTIEERYNDKEITLKDAKIVLMELGSPNQLYEKYDNSSDKCLIGQPYYNYYKDILKIVLTCAIFGIVLSYIVNIGNQSISKFISDIIFAAILSFSFVTLIFIFMYKFNIDFLNNDIDFDKLPKLPNNNIKTNKYFSLLSILFAVIFLSLFILSPSIFSFNIDGKFINLFNTDIIKSSYLFAVFFIVLLIFREIIKIVDNSYNIRNTILFIAINIFSAVVSFVWFFNYNLINEVFIDSLIKDVSNNLILSIFNNFQMFCFFMILLALVLDSIDKILKFRRNC